MSVAPPPSPLGSPQVRGVLYQSWPQPDGTLRLVYLSDNAEDLLETSAEDLARMALTQTLPLIHPDPAAFYRSIVESARNHTPWAADFGFITPRTGRHLWLRAQDFPLRTPEGIPYFSGVLLDITHVKETERQLAKAYQILSSHLDNTPLGVVEWDANGLVIRWSNQCEKIFGWPASAVLGKKPSEWNFIPPEDWEQVVEAWGRLSTGTDRRSVTRSRNLHQDGRLVHCEWHNSVQTDEHGTVVSVLSLVMDLTEETQARELASRSEKRLRTALQYAGMLGWDYDFRAKEVYYSTDLGEYYGAPELVGYQDPDSELRSVHPEDRERVGKEFQKAIEGCGEMRAEFRGVASGPDGNPRWFVTRARVFPGPDRHPVQIIGVTTDVTDRKQAELEREVLEKELQESRKRESLGLLAGGIAHDFNNILTIILGNVGVARGAVGPDSLATRSLREIEDASHRAADLCRQFAAFAGTGRFVSENMDLSTVLRDAEPVLATALRAGVSLRLELEDSLPLITADPFQIRQMILNLVLNGSEAAPAEGGWVRIRTSHTVIPASGTEPGYTPHIPAGEYVAIDVTDNGHGMDEPTRSKVFDPFFTTKSTGRGLGLAAVYGIVRSHFGAIRIDSTPECGTTVRVLLPGRTACHSGPSVARSGGIAFPAPRTPIPEDSSFWRASGTALVVDDEPNVRELTASLLEDVGFTVVAASDGAEALAAMQANPGQFRLALIDMLMPGMTGEELLREFRRLRADLPVVVMTGFTNRALPEDLASQPGTALVVKPFRLERLLQILRETMESVQKPAT